MSHRSLLIIVLALSFLIRVEAVQWNWFMHGDTIDDAVVAASLHRDGSFLAYGGADTSDPDLFPLPPAEKMELLKQHGPLWPMLGTVVTWIYGGDSSVYFGFLSLRILSLLSGMFLIALSYALASRLAGKTAGLAVAAWTGASYVLIDFAGNGSFYSFQGLIYLCWILVTMTSPSVRRAVLLGVLMALGYLANFQCVILIPAGLVLFFFDGRGWKTFFLHSVLMIGVAAVVVAPWLIRSQLLFGDPLYSHAWNMRYVHGKMGWDIPAEGVLKPNLDQQLQILRSALFSWLPNNLYYAARKLFVLAPIAFFLFSFGLIDIAFSKKRITVLLPLLLVMTFHILLSAGWPIWKFRYFVPLLPLVFIIAAEQVQHLKLREQSKQIWMYLIFVAIFVVSILTYRATPARTTYYDGALTQDPFHGSEERSYLESYGILAPSNEQ